MDTSFVVPPKSPLQAKRSARDAKLKKLQNLLSHQTTTGETSTEASATIASYQHGGAPDVENAGHIVMIQDEEPTLLREQIQSLIHHSDEDNDRGTSSSTILSSTSAAVHKMNTKQKAASAAVLLILLYWWL